MDANIALSIILEIKLACIDCGCYRKQNFVRLMPDNTLLYVCQTCGCENSMDIDVD